MAYRDDVLALNPDHLWPLDNVLTDAAGAVTLTNTGCTFPAGGITEDAANRIQSNGTGDRFVAPTTADIDGALDRKVVCGWLRLTAIQLPPKSVYREGTTSSQFCLVCWGGNNLMLDVVNGATVKQVFADQVLQPNRVYHILARVEGTGFGDKVELYIDGVAQSVSDTLGAATLAARSAAEWSDPSGSTEVGNATVLLNGLVNGDFNFWATFSGADAQLTDTEIREELFEKGALPDVTITSGTEAAMQTQLDALVDTAREDAPLCIRVEAVTGDGDLTLSADNVTFDPLASIHVQYMGTGTLTWVNTNGADASIGSTPNGGTLTFVTPATLTVAPLIANTEVRVYDAGTTTELAGIENSTTSFAQTINAAAVDVVVHQPGYLNIRVDNVDMTQGDVTVPISQVVDRQYENP